MALEGLCGTKRHGVPVLRPAAAFLHFRLPEESCAATILDTFIGENVKKRPPVLNSLHISKGRKNKKLAEKTKM